MISYNLSSKYVGLQSCVCYNWLSANNIQCFFLPAVEGLLFGAVDVGVGWSALTSNLILFIMYVPSIRWKVKTMSRFSGYKAAVLWCVNIINVLSFTTTNL